MSVSPAQNFEATAGAGGTDRHLNVGLFLVEELGGRGGQRKDGARAVDDDAAHKVAAGASFVVVATGGQGEGEGEHDAAGAAARRRVLRFMDMTLLAGVGRIVRPASCRLTFSDARDAG